MLDTAAPEPPPSPDRVYARACSKIEHISLAKDDLQVLTRLRVLSFRLGYTRPQTSEF